MWWTGDATGSRRCWVRHFLMCGLAVRFTISRHCHVRSHLIAQAPPGAHPPTPRVLAIYIILFAGVRRRFSFVVDACRSGTCSASGISRFAGNGAIHVSSGAALSFGGHAVAWSSLHPMWFVACYCGARSLFRSLGGGGPHLHSILGCCAQALGEVARIKAASKTCSYTSFTCVDVQMGMHAHRCTRSICKGDIVTNVVDW